MEKYIELIENKKYMELANISFINELIEYKYKDKYLIEYLLENNIHSEAMDKYLVYHKEFVKFYLKYNTIKPLLNCSLKVLLDKIDGNLIIDIILDKLDDKDKIILYNNIRKNSFSDFHYYENDIIDIFLKHGIVVPKLFVTTNIEKNIELDEEDKELINNFLDVFKDNEFKILNFVVNELKKGLIKNHDRTVLDIKKLIEFKKNNSEFKFIDSKNRGGESYDAESLEFKTNTMSSLMFNHEFSHFLYESNEDTDSIIEEYENIRSKIDTEESLEKIKNYLNLYHSEYEKSKDKFIKLYYDKVKKMYGDFDNYVEHIYLEMKDSIPELIEIWNSETKSLSYPFVMEFNFKDIVFEYLEQEKNEFVYLNLKNYFSNYRMLENLLDALLNGKLFDDTSFKCLSGHGSFYFESLNTRSFDECLANYDALKKDNDESLLNDLEILVGSELINFLNNYIKINREVKNGK